MSFGQPQQAQCLSLSCWKKRIFVGRLETSDEWWWKGQAMPCLSFSWTTAQMSAAAFKWSLLDHSSSFWSFPNWQGSCFCVSWLLCVAVPTALNGHLASCDVPGNCFQWFFKQQLANMAHYGSLALNNELLSLVFVPWVLLSAPTHKAKCGLSLGSPGGTGSWVSSYVLVQCQSLSCPFSALLWKALSHPSQ